MKKKIVRLQRTERTSISVSTSDRVRFQQLSNGLFDWQFFAHLIDFYERYRHLEDDRSNDIAA